MITIADTGEQWCKSGGRGVGGINVFFYIYIVTRHRDKQISNISKEN